MFFHPRAVRLCNRDTRIGLGVGTQIYLDHTSLVIINDRGNGPVVDCSLSLLKERTAAAGTDGDLALQGLANGGPVLL